MNPKRSGKKVRQLSNSALQSLNTYALAAGAAGVSVLAMSPAAEAKIVYTPAHVMIGALGMGSYNLDLNQDGITDFVIERTDSCDVGRCFSYLAVIQKDGGVAYGGKVQGCLAMPAGAVIGPRRMFYSGFVGMAGVYSHWGTKSDRGNWVNVSNQYLGLKFLINGETHYGWARFTVSVKAGVTGILSGFAYETVANQPIIAGQTSSAESAVLAARDSSSAALGMLARGADGLQIWRREELNGQE